MNRIALLLVAGMTASGCEGVQDPPTTSTVAPEPTFVLFGSVRDSSGAPLTGAVADVIAGPFAGLSDVSNDAGYFAFRNVRGPLTLRVSRDDYETYDKTFEVMSDLAIDVLMRKAVYSDSIEFGRTIRSTVSATAAPCDPIRWDARAPCRRFTLRPNSSGVLFIEIKWAGQPALDATVVTRQGDYVSTSDELHDGLLTLVVGLTAGQTYEVRVNSYYGSQTFDLRAEFIPQ